MDEAAEKAAGTYLRMSTASGDCPARHATRAVFLQMRLLQHAPRKKREAALLRDVAQAFVDQSTQESSLCAALLLEQAGERGQGEAM